MNDASQVRAAFREAVNEFGPGPAWILGHNDADGLSAVALFARAFAASGRPVRTRVVGRGESPWSDAMRAELAGEAAGGVVVTDLGVRDASPMLGVKLVVVDHHVPGTPPEGSLS